MHVHEKERTGGDEVIDDNDILAFLHAVNLHFEGILELRKRWQVQCMPIFNTAITHRSILLLIQRLHTFSRKLPRFPHGYESSAEPQRKDRPNEEPASIQSHNSVDLLWDTILRDSWDDCRRDMVQEVCNECLECDGVA